MNASIQHLIHNAQDHYPHALRCDRRTQWGNPFRIDELHTRNIVIAQFAIYLHTRIDLANAALKQLPGKHLESHCAPKRCHTEILALYANGVHTLKELDAKAAAYLRGINPAFIIEAELKADAYNNKLTQDFTSD